MSWNYRVIRATDPDGEDFFAMHECFYDGPESAIPESWSAGPVRVTAETPDGLSWVLEQMKVARTKPVLEERDGKLVEVSS